MRTLVVSYEWPGVTDNCGGGGRIGAELVDGLRDRGHTVRVVTDPNDGHYLTFPVRRYRAVDRAMAEFAPDVLHGLFSVPSSLPAARLAGRHGVPLVVTVMGADLFDPTRYRFLKYARDLANRYVFARADAVAVPSMDMHARLPNRVAPVARVIHYGIDPDNWPAAGAAPPPHRWLTVARLVDRKRHERAIRALARAREWGYDCRYDVVGTGPRADALRREYGDRDWLTFHGFVDDVADAYRRATAFVLPSVYEAFGIVYLEALASGLPVVMTPGGQADILTAVDSDDRPGIIADATVSSVADAVWAVMDQYDHYRANTRGYVAEHFDRASMVDAYEALYERPVRRIIA